MRLIISNEMIIVSLLSGLLGCSYADSQSSIHQRAIHINAGDPIALYTSGEAYTLGTGLPQNDQQAPYATDKSKAQGNLAAEAAEVAVTPDGSRAFVTNRGDHRVSVINVRSGAVLNSIMLADPWGVAFSPDGSEAYVVGPDSAVLTVIDTSTGHTIDSPIAFGGNS